MSMASYVIEVKVNDNKKNIKHTPRMFTITNEGVIREIYRISL